MAEATLAERLAAFAVASGGGGVPEEVRSSVKQRVFDTLGIALAASVLDTSGAVLDIVGRHGGKGEARVIGLDHRVPAASAAFANGVLAHSLDYDDTHLPSVLHPSAVVVPAGLAAAEAGSASGSQLLDAIAVGIETTVRIGMGGFDAEARNSTFFEHGQHATSICGTIGAAVTAAMLEGLDERQIVDAIGIAASMASGIIEGNRTGGTVKRLHCGWAAQAGLRAAELAAAGFTGPPTALEGRFGLYEAFLHGTFDAGAVTTGLGVEWEVPGIFFKPYPANHFTHTAADAVMDLAGRGLTSEEIDTIRVGVAGPTVRTIGEPIAAKRRPNTGYQAQFSGPYVVAAALLGGGGLGLALDDFRDDLVAEDRRLDLMDRVTIEADPRCDAIFPHQFPAIVDVKTRSGDHLTVAVLVNRGSPENPLSEDDLRLKFRTNVDGLMDVSVVQEVWELCETLESVDEAGTLIWTINEARSSR